ncbi:4Fe-4S dicluster domain-containing protein [Pelotalea chapellei]|uniref:4Fe-4S dicluster domain-containing protein n=1 Tax=Pelotalea chapellei TaxID=44671 RepID=A0ABS5UD18_9BACT|nr:4Fe-4S dicluster domain-containing protein [Pelotalea chapellei]MBT1073586.1 4Fe-4S dicluster domain-containing protein [Pelotalea chapellei]
MKKQQHENAIVFADPERCLGCHSCELSCAVAHSGCDLYSAAIKGLTLRPRNKVVAAGDASIPIQCRQCEDAPCALACPTGAILQQDSMVSIREKNCVGCKVCVMVCPFGAISVKPDADGDLEAEGRTNRGVARKCDLCARTGRDVPACIEACPTKAITLVNLDDLRQTLLEARAAELAHSYKYLKQRKVKP